MHVGSTSLFNNEDQCEKYCQTITVLLGLIKMLYNGANMRNEQLFRWNRLWPSVVPLNINKLLCQFLVPTGFRLCLCQSPLSFSLSDRLLAMCSEKNCYKFIHWTFKNIPIAVDQSNYLTLYSFAWSCTKYAILDRGSWRNCKVSSYFGSVTFFLYKKRFQQSEMTAGEEILDNRSQRKFVCGAVEGISCSLINISWLARQHLFRIHQGRLSRYILDN